MQLGVFGGSFDPVHNGHLKVAEACAGAVPLDRLFFVPAAVQPHKPEGPAASASDRLAMLSCAIAPCAGWEALTMEIDRGGVSYTVDTLRQLASDRSRDRLFLILGTDALADLPNWREPSEIVRLATLVVVNRLNSTMQSQGSTPNLSYESSIKDFPGAIEVGMQPVAISSTEIRRRAAAGQSIEGLVPPAVARYIAKRGLYK